MFNKTFKMNHSGKTNKLNFEFTIYINDVNKINYLFKNVYDIINNNYNNYYTVTMCRDRKNLCKITFFLTFFRLDNNIQFDYYQFKSKYEKIISRSIEKFVWTSEDTSDEEQEYYIFLRYIHPFQSIYHKKRKYNYVFSIV